jgi:MFS family permease
LVSLIADGALLWSLLIWSTTAGKTSGLSLLSMMGPGPLVYLLLLPVLGVVSDRLPRKTVLTVSLGIRAAIHLLTAGLLKTELLGASSLLFCQVTALIGTASFDAACASTVPKLVDPEQAPRALGYGLSLPRAGFFLTAVFCLFLVMIVGPVPSLLVGSLFLLLAAVMTQRLKSATGTDNQWSWLSLPKQLFAGVQIGLLTPGVPWLGGLAALANCVIHPLFDISPWKRVTPSNPATETTLRSPLETLVPNTPAPQETLQLEFWLVAGVVVGAVLLQRQLRSVSTEKIFAGSLLWLALGLVILGLSSGELLPPLATLLMGVGMLPLACLTAGISMLGVPDGYRSRVSALLAMLFGLGGELGQLVLTPLFARHGIRLTMVGLAVPIGLLGLALTTHQTLPKALRSPQIR